MQLQKATSLLGRKRQSGAEKRNETKIQTLLLTHLLLARYNRFFCAELLFTEAAFLTAFYLRHSACTKRLILWDKRIVEATELETPYAAFLVL
jgi:hypothetical protein